MSPSLTTFNSRNYRWVYTVLFRNLPLRFSGHANFFDLIKCKLGVTVLFSKGISLFLSAITVVVQSGPNKKMSRIYATSIVARMANYIYIRKITDVNLIRNTVRSLRSPVFPYKSISISTAMPGPFPASGLFDFVKFRKSVFNRFMSGFVGQQCSSPLGLVIMVTTKPTSYNRLLTKLASTFHGLCVYTKSNRVNSPAIGGCYF